MQAVDAVYDTAAADALGLFAEQVVVTIHTGSRGLGYQTCEDNLRSMVECPLP